VLCAAAKDAGLARPLSRLSALARALVEAAPLAEGGGSRPRIVGPMPNNGKSADVVAFITTTPRGAAIERGAGCIFRVGRVGVLHWSMNAKSGRGTAGRRLGRAWGRRRVPARPGGSPVLPHEITAGFGSATRVDETIGNHGRLRRFFGAGHRYGEGNPSRSLGADAGGEGVRWHPGHFTWTFDDPLYRVLLLRGLCWVAHNRGSIRGVGDRRGPVGRVMEPGPLELTGASDAYARSRRSMPRANSKHPRQVEDWVRLFPLPSGM